MKYRHDYYGDYGTAFAVNADGDWRWWLGRVRYVLCLPSTRYDDCRLAIMRHEYARDV